MNNSVFVTLGLMSGTSLDGVDAAFLETDGERILRFGPALTVDYTSDERETLAIATQAALRWGFNGARPNSFSAAETVIHAAHIRAVDTLCKAHTDWAERLDMIGFHGQTVLHHPPLDGNAGKTCQLGNGQVLADHFGVPVWYDFRSHDVSEGGQGAPLAPIYHAALVAFSDLPKPCGVLNIGGVSNVTLVSDNALLATDCGPGNGPLDNWVEQNSDAEFDENGALSLSGAVDFDRVNKWLSRDFFMRPFPKSADRYDFDVLSELSASSLQDGAANLAAFTVLGIKKSLQDMGDMPQSLIICGGGRYNKAMMWMLSAELGIPVMSSEQVGWNGDAIEAEAFGYLAARGEKNLPISFPKTTGAPRPLCGGRVARPLNLRST